MDTAKFWVEVISAISIPVGIVAVTWNRTVTKKGLSVRAIQFLCLAVFVPLVLILGLEDILNGGAIGALLGALIGYLFANIGKYDDNRNGPAND